MLFKYKLDYMLVSMLMLACLDNIFAAEGFVFTKCASILEAYFDKMFVRCDYTAMSSIAHKISDACLSFSILSVLIRV